MSKKVKRLYGQLVPEHYDLRLTISEDKQTFSGSVTIITARKERPSERLTLHQKELNIDNVKVVHTDKKGQDKEIKISRVVKHKAFDELRLHSEETLYPGKYTISMNFSGKITKNMDGIYPCLFKENGQEKKLIATQLESHHAREVFPCIDEPEAKATFKLDLTHAKDEIALSNTPVEDEKVSGKTKTSSFEKTPIMSTYLFAFVVGDMEFKTAKSKSGVEINIYSTPEQIQHADFALETAVKCMDFYEDYYDIPFPLPKCDFVALPDFSSGAMENWGLITFREQLLLCDEEHTTLGTKQYIAIVVAHELTHQWFGNLVTMRWWTDLWLNEGFASWMEYLAVDNIFPEWHLWTQFTVDEQQTAMRADALEHTHPIEVEVKHPDEIRSIFDIISYQKGASSIHMLHDYLGDEGFRDGLRHYLKKHSYDNTDTVDLWQALEDKTGKPVKDFMGIWTSQNGFPILQVEESNDHLKIKQSRFVANPKSESRKDNTLWPVPLLSGGLTKSVISKASNNVPFSGKHAPIKMNEGQTGLYRVNYSHDLQQRQLKAIDKGELADIDRMGMLADSLEVTKAGYQSVSEYLELLEHFKNEDSLAVWEIIASGIGSIRSVLSPSDEDDSLRDKMKPYIRELISLQLKRLGWEEKETDSHLDKLLRPIIIGLGAGADEPKILEKIEKAYRANIDEGASINPNLRGIIYSTMTRRGSEKEYEELLKLYKETHSADLKLSITGAMTSFKQPKLHKKIFELIKTDTVRNQDLSYWIAYSFMNRHSKTTTWQWYKNNWDWLNKEIGTDLSFARMPLYAGRVFNTDNQIKDYVEFFKDKITPNIERTYNQGLEMAQTNAQWHKRDSKTVLKCFDKFS